MPALLYVQACNMKRHFWHTCFLTAARMMINDPEKKPIRLLSASNSKKEK